MISLFRSLTFFSSCSFGILLLSLLLALRLPCPISLLESLEIITRYYCESYSTSRFNKFRIIESFQYKDLKRLYCHHPTLLPDNTYFDIFIGVRIEVSQAHSLPEDEGHCGEGNSGH